MALQIVADVIGLAHVPQLTGPLHTRSYIRPFSPFRGFIAGPHLPYHPGLNLEHLLSSCVMFANVAKRSVRGRAYKRFATPGSFPKLCPRLSRPPAHLFW